MPTSMTFDSLVEDLQEYLERGTSSDTEVFNQIPRLINLAERAITNKLKIQGFLTPMISTLVAGTSVYAKPDRWRQTVSMNYGTGTDQNSRSILLARSYDYCRVYWPDSSVMDTTQPPLYYADYDYAHWLVVPTPPINYPWEINLYQMPALLDSTNQTNWLTNYAPNLLLYRALLEMTPFLKDDERIPTWQAMYTEQLQDLDLQDIQKVVDRDSVRSKA